MHILSWSAANAGYLALVALAACSKSAPTKADNAENKKPAPPAGSAAGSGSAAEPAPAEAAAVVGPTKSATGTLQVSGVLSGTFEWKKKDQRSPISCVWDAEKEIGGFHIDLSDGAGHLISLGIDIPPTDVGPGRLDVSSKELAAPLKTFKGFKVSGDEAGTIKATFENAEAVTDPDAQLSVKPDKKHPPSPTVGGLGLSGTLEVTCPKK